MSDFFEGCAHDMTVGIMHYLLNSNDETKTLKRATDLIMSIRFNPENDRIDENCELAQCLSKYSEAHPIFDVTTSLWEWLSTSPIATIKCIIPQTHVIFH